MAGLSLLSPVLFLLCNGTQAQRHNVPVPVFTFFTSIFPFFPFPFSFKVDIQLLMPVFLSLSVCRSGENSFLSFLRFILTLPVFSVHIWLFFSIFCRHFLKRTSVVGGSRVVAVPDRCYQSALASSPC